MHLAGNPLLFLCASGSGFARTDLMDSAVWVRLAEAQRTVTLKT